MVERRRLAAAVDLTADEDEAAFANLRRADAADAREPLRPLGRRVNCRGGVGAGGSGPSATAVATAAAAGGSGAAAAAGAVGPTPGGAGGAGACASRPKPKQLSGLRNSPALPLGAVTYPPGHPSAPLLDTDGNRGGDRRRLRLRFPLASLAPLAARPGCAPLTGRGSRDGLDDHDHDGYDGDTAATQPGLFIDAPANVAAAGAAAQHSRASRASNDSVLAGVDVNVVFGRGVEQTFDGSRPQSARHSRGSFDAPGSRPSTSAASCGVVGSLRLGGVQVSTRVMACREGSRF